MKNKSEQKTRTILSISERPECTLKAFKRSTDPLALYLFRSTILQLYPETWVPSWRLSICYRTFYLEVDLFIPSDPLSASVMGISDAFMASCQSSLSNRGVYDVIRRYYVISSRQSGPWEFFEACPIYVLYEPQVRRHKVAHCPLRYLHLPSNRLGVFQISHRQLCCDRHQVLYIGIVGGFVTA